MSDQDHTDSRRERLGATYQENTPKNVSGGYTKFVKILRVVFPLIALVIIGVLIFSSDKEPPALPVEEIEAPVLPGGKPVIDKNELVKPEFESQTKDGKTYRITADNATQELRQPDLILLDQPRGTLEADPYPVKISANDGTYDQKTQFMTLNQNVVISQEETGRIELITLEADMERGEMFSPHTVKAQGTYGTLEAASMKITENGNKIVLNGPATLIMTEGFDTWIK